MSIFDDKMRECPLIAILRGITPAEVLPVSETMFQAGVRLLEITMNSPEALESIRLAAGRWHSGGEMLIGAGTVLTAEEAKAVAAVGGRFIISPDTNPDVIRATKACGMVSIPGFFTATEAFTALRAGADYLKLFPAEQVGPGYIKAIKAVVKAPIMAVGGVNAENLGAFLKVSVGAGIGSNFYKPGKSLEAIAADVREMVEIVKAARA